MSTRLTAASKTLPRPTASSQPGKVRSARQRRQRTIRDGAAMFQHQDVRREAHDIVEVVRHENQRHVAASDASCRSRSEDACGRHDRRQRTARRAAAPRARAQAPARARRADARRRTIRVDVSTRVQPGGRAPAVPRPWPDAPLADDGRARSSRCREPSDAETARTPGTRTPPRVDEAARTRRRQCPSMCRHRTARGRALGGRGRRCTQDRRLAAARRPEDREHVTRVAREFDVERYRTLLAQAPR